MTRRFLDCLCYALVLSVFVAAGYVAVTEFIELRNRVETLEERADREVDVEISSPSPFVTFKVS